MSLSYKPLYNDWNMIDVMGASVIIDREAGRKSGGASLADAARELSVRYHPSSARHEARSPEREHIA